MRRKIQRGGNGSLALVAPLAAVLAALFVNNPVVKGFMPVLSVVVGGYSQQGGNKRLNQMGGGRRLLEVLSNFGVTIEDDPNIPPAKKTELRNCIKTLQDNGGIPDTVIAEMNQPGPEDENVKGIQIGGFFNDLTVIGKNFGSAVKDKTTNFGSAVKDKATNFGSTVQQKATEVGSAVEAKFIQEIKPQIDNVKTLIIAKVSHMKDQNKQQCMKIILSHGFESIKAQFDNVSLQDIKNAMAAKAATATANAADMATAAKTKASQLLVKSVGFLSNLSGNSPSSTPLPGNGGGIQVHPIKIRTGGTFIPDMTKGFAEFTNFEERLKEELKSRGWPGDETALDKAIENYIKSVNPTIWHPLGCTIFIFAVLSGMIISIEFTNDKTAEKVNITTAADFMKRYYDNASKHPYSKFKQELFDIVTSSNTKIATGLSLKITTDFSKTPDYASVQAKAAADANDALKAALKAANKQTFEVYSKAQEELSASKFKVDEAQKALTDAWMSLPATKTRLQQNLDDVNKKHQFAIKNYGDKYQLAFKAAKAAQDGGWREDEITWPKYSTIDSTTPF
jgi:hypothetical protein